MDGLAGRFPGGGGGAGGPIPIPPGGGGGGGGGGGKGMLWYDSKSIGKDRIREVTEKEGKTVQASADE